MILKFLRNKIPERSPFRIIYHRFSAMGAAMFYGFPAKKLTVIGVTGTSGKSSTVELIHTCLQGSGIKTGALSTIQFHIGEKIIENESLRTSLRPWETQKFLKKMVRAGCSHAVLEVSSHAIDQHRFWGVPFDVGLVTNIFDHEHLDYHGNLADYIRTKSKLLKGLNHSLRKPGIPKVSILNADDEQFDLLKEIPVDQKWTFSLARSADVVPQNLELRDNETSFSCALPNFDLNVSVPLIGRHNVANLCAAIATCLALKVDPVDIQVALSEFTGIPSRMQPIDAGQKFSTIIDFSYKPSALEAVLTTLKDIVKGKIYVVWGGAGGRSAENWQKSGEMLDRYADEFILTTDDPYDVNPKLIAKKIREVVTRKEGDGFFEIPDRYEAIRYALYMAQPGDLVLIAGRGQEKVQTIGAQKIDFFDEEVVREILNYAQNQSFTD